MESACKREVFEESNIQVTDVIYHSSQPWPMNGSLMLGFIAQATNEDIKVRILRFYVP